MNRICIILYACDILLIAPLVTMLEKLLHMCKLELHWLDVLINTKKSCCMRIGPRADAVYTCNNMTCFSGLSLRWINEIRHLGIFVKTSRYFKCSLDHAKRSFYRSANAIFGKVGRIATEEVILQLLIQ